MAHRATRAGLLATFATLGVLLAACGGTSYEYAGPTDGELLNGEQLEEAVWEVRGEGEDVEDGVRFVLGGQPVDAERADGVLRYDPDQLDDGEHTLEAHRVGEDDGDPEVLHTWEFAVDATPPALELTAPDGPLIAGEPVAVAGTTEPGATVRVGDQEVTAGDDGTFELELGDAPDGELRLAAVDVAGNTAEADRSFVTVPSRVEVDLVRGVHVTPYIWATESARNRILGMVDDGIINTVVMTLKGEDGWIGWDSDIELAEAAGANQGVIDLEEVIASLHERGVHVAGRIVAFRDPKLGPYARDNGHDDWLARTADGEPYVGRYECCFTNFANPDVIEYNLAIAEEAARYGIDSILWDYIRKPDGPRENLTYAGIPDDEPLEPPIVEFTRLADERLAPYGLDHGASLYGIAADRPTQIAQDVPEMSKHLDYVSPMIYPSHWGPGEYDVADPNRQPYDIVVATLEIWQEAVDERARIVPWLEDTTYRAWDRPHQVREQIRGARDRDIEEFLMWDPAVRYTPEAYDRMPQGRDE